MKIKNTQYKFRLGIGNRCLVHNQVAEVSDEIGEMLIKEYPGVIVKVEDSTAAQVEVKPEPPRMVLKSQQKQQQFAPKPTPKPDTGVEV